MIRFCDNTEDEVFISHEAAARGVEIVSTVAEPLAGWHYYGPDVHPNLPVNGALKKNKLLGWNCP